MTDSLPVAPDTSPTASRGSSHRGRRWKQVLLSLVIFVSGAVAGTGITLIVIRDHVLGVIHRPEEMPARIAGHMRRLLNLTDQQVEQIESILGRRHLALQDIRRRFQPQVETELDRVEREISEVLNEDQRARWRRHFEQLRNTWVPSAPPEHRDRPAGQ